MGSNFKKLKEYSALSWISYDDVGHLKNKILNGYTEKDKSNEPFKKNYTSSGFQATAFEKENEIVIAIRGTEALNEFWDDLLIADGSLALNYMPNSQAGSMIDYINGIADILKTYKQTGKNITIVGHSLGGTLAQIASKMYPSLFDNCYTFNSPSGNNLNYHKIYKDSDGKYYWLGNEQVNFKHYIEDKIGEAFHHYQNTSMTTSVTDARAKDAFSLIVNLWRKERFAERIEVSRTNSNYGIWKAA
ncbi:Mbeg1-like protein [Campylobacter sp. RM16189]|uniref:lipase family protein n=1 Tax=Campylobacter sp. RM16189 TaxID=1705726 RepID=UPI001473B993|nr:Mbeg1-like protein [Campylobacter sp. RM16189]